MLVFLILLIYAFAMSFESELALLFFFDEILYLWIGRKREVNLKVLKVPEIEQKVIRFSFGFIIGHYNPVTSNFSYIWIYPFCICV